MPDKIKFFTADYRDTFVYINKNKFKIGNFTVDFLNQYNLNDNGARIAVMAQNNWLVSSSMGKGYLNDYEFVNAGKEILYILDVLPNLSPFHLLDIESEKKLIKETFTKENAEVILKFYKERAFVSLQDEGAMALDILPDGYDEFSEAANKLISRVKQLLQFYENVGMDMIKAHNRLLQFVDGLDDLENYKESNLLTLAYKIFGANRFNVITEYAAVSKNSKNNEKMLVKRLHFRSYYSFILTDFFEGLALGHYPRQCEICEKYFFMEGARRQKYCTGYAPLELTGRKQLTCRQYAAKMGKKEKAAEDPIKVIYEKRCSCIRAEVSKGVIDLYFAKIAKNLAKELKVRADYDDDYTFEEYQRDMERDNLYKMADEIIKQE